MPRPLTLRHPGEPYGEKDFYLEDFRGRSVLLALDPACVASRPDFGPLAAAACDLVANQTRVIVWCPAVGAAAERRLRTALRRAPRGRRRGKPPVELMRVDVADLDGREAAGLRGALWTRLGGGLCVLVVEDDGRPASLARAAALATALQLPKLVLIDAAGGLLGTAPRRLSFVDETLLETLLHAGEAEWSGLGERRGLLVAVREALRGGVEAVNLCTPEGIADELFTYDGSGTLFTQGDYCHVAPLALDDFAQAERLLERGQREGLLKLRSPEEIADVLGAGFGATIGRRHLAGVAGLLTAPYAAERAGEIVGLYTITRFKGEGIGERLVSRLVSEAERRALDYVFACAVDERAQQFFVRLGFGPVAKDDVPAAKWVGYDARRRDRVAVLKRALLPAVAVDAARA